MKIEFTKFSENSAYVSGLVNDGEYHFEARLQDEPNEKYGINQGRVTGLAVSIGSEWKGFDNCIINYDRGWDIEPYNTPDYNLFEMVLAFLDMAPQRFGGGELAIEH
jgi:hypothetical protein